MAELPLRLLPIHAALGEQESHESLTLPQVHGSGGSFNVWMDKFGRITPVLGYSRRNSNPEPVAGYPAILRGMHRYAIFQHPVALTDLVLGFFDSTVGAGTSAGHYTLKSSADRGATWTDLKDFGIYAPGYQPDFAQLGTAVVFAPPAYNGVYLQQIYNGTTVNPIQAIRMPAPAVADGGAGFMNGTFKVRIVPMHSDGSRGTGSPLSEQIQLEDRILNTAWLADSHPLTTGYEVYCTTGTGNVLFYVGQTTALTMSINLLDLDIIEGRVCEEHGDFNLVAAFVEVHGQRMWYGGISLSLVTGAEPYPRRWYYSDPGRPESLYEFNFMDASDAENLGGGTTGATGNFNNTFVIWMEDSVWAVSGTGKWIGDVIDYRLRKSNAKAGSVTHRTVARVPAGAKYTNSDGQFVQTSQVTLAYLTPFKDIRLFDGDGDTIISFAGSTDLASMGSYASVRAHVIEDQDHSELTWCFPSIGSLECDRAVTWNYKWGITYARPLWSFACSLPMIRLGVAVVALGDSTPNVILAGAGSLAIGGLCYRLWDTFRADDAPFSWQWMSKTLYGLARSGESESASELMSFLKRFRWTELVIKKEYPFLPNPVINVAWLPGESVDSATVIGTRAYTLDQTKHVRVDHLVGEEFYHDTGMRLKISGVSE